MSKQQFAEQFAAAMNEKFPAVQAWDDVFGVTVGTKYAKVVCQKPGVGNSGYVYCFIDDFGNVYKAEGWAKPAKGVRANIAAEAHFVQAVERADKFGGWLYAR